MKHDVEWLEGYRRKKSSKCSMKALLTCDAVIIAVTAATGMTRQRWLARSKPRKVLRP